MLNPTEQEQMEANEVRAGLAWKWIAFAVEIGAMPFLAPAALAAPWFWTAAALWLVHAIFYTVQIWRGPVPVPAFRIYASFILDLALLAALIILSADMESLYAYLYPAHMLGMVILRPSWRDVVASAALAFVVFNISYLGAEGTVHLYQDAFHWFQLLFIGLLVVGPAYRLRLLLYRHEQTVAEKYRVEQSASQLARYSEELEELSFSDPLTGLYNRRYFESRLGEELARANKTGQPLSLMMLDIDYFKQYNDTHGHVRGDEVLKGVAALIKQACRATDVVCRYGGEEFAAILPAIAGDSAVIVAERVRGSVEEFEFQGRETQPRGRLTISIGIAVHPTDATEADALLHLADQALYRAKDAGRNAVVLHASLAACVGSSLNSMDKRLLEMTHVIQSLLAAANARDHYTLGHSERVAEYAGDIGAHMGLPPDEVRRIRYAALVHDLGNIGVSPGILLKEEALDEEEQALLRQHTLLGVSIIEPFGDLRDLIPIVACHHEHWDGTGYPGGLSGTAIPIGARIMATADAFDAMRQHRPWRPALTAGEAAAELVHGAGTQFDPAVIRAFLEVLAESGDVVPETATRLLAGPNCQSA